MEIETAYNQALDYLYSFVDYSLTRNFRNAAEKFDLERMKQLMERLGDPQKNYKIIHVAGTKGKGSTSALIESALRVAGYRTGFYISPHLEDYCERIQVDRIQISHQDLVGLITKIKPVVAEIPHLTTFEITTALGFIYFSQKNVDLAVVEVGLGGRLDATNIVDPLVAVITSLSYDHMAVLGDTLSQIAFEKAGIIKPGRPVVSSPQKDEALKVVERIAQERGSHLTIVGKDTLFAANAHSLSGQSLFVWPASEQAMVDEFIESGGQSEWEPQRLTIPLLGYHQVENAATAYTALQIIREEGFAISEREIRRGFERVNWEGRFEILQRIPPIIIDSAHNRDSALKLRLTLDDYLAGQPVILIFGASEDKDVQGMFAELLPRVKKVIATQSIHPRALDANRLVEIAHSFGVPAKVVLPLEEALHTAIAEADGEAIILATGSIFIAAAIRETWKQLNEPELIRALK
jgi:dihydrofolate synthase/folylpolyglutamate synthase